MIRALAALALLSFGRTLAAEPVRPVVLPPAGPLGGYVAPAPAPALGAPLAPSALPGPGDLTAIAAAGRDLYQRFAPALYMPVAVSLGREPGALPGAAAHGWSPAAGHSIVFYDHAEGTESAPDAAGKVGSSFGDPEKLRVSARLERLLAYVHEHAHAVFGETVGNLEARPRDSIYNAVNEGFAVSVERRVMDGLLREGPALGLSDAESADLHAMRRARAAWLRSEDNFYTEGFLRVWQPLSREAGDSGLREFLDSLRSARLLELTRQDAAYQLSQDKPQRLKALLLEGKTAPTAELLETAHRHTLERFFRLYLLREQEMRVNGAPVRYTQRWKDGLEPRALFSLVRESPRARKLLSRWLARAARAGKLGRVFEDGRSPARLQEIAAGAESLPWSKADRQAWDEGLTRFIAGTLRQGP